MFIGTYLSTNTYNVYYIAILIISHEVIKVKRCFNTSYDPPKTTFLIYLQLLSEYYGWKKVICQTKCQGIILKSSQKL